MDFREFWKESLVAFFLKRIVLATLIFVALGWGTLYFIKVYTNHGESVVIPDLQGLYFEEAVSLLRKHDLYAEIIDSVFVRNKPLGTIVEQIPAANSFVKKDRSIFLIMNQRQIRTIPLPDLNDVSLRQADALIKSLGLRVSSIEYRPSEFKDLVIDVLHNDTSITSGTRLVEGSSVTLIVGSGIGDGVSFVPTLIGFSQNEARRRALSMSFVMGSVEYDGIPDENDPSYVVYRQSPTPGSQMPAGTRINIWLTRDLNTVNQSVNQQVIKEQEEDFF